MEIFIIFLLGANLAVLLLLWRKVRKIHLFCWTLKEEAGKQSVNVIRNMESLDSLYRELNLAKSLPPTMGFAGSPDFLRLIAEYAAGEDVDHILECSSGLSTIVLAQVMKLKGRGHVYSLENDAQYADISRENLEKYGLEDWATVITAPLTEVSLQGQVYNWYDIDGKLPEIDFDGLVIDGPPWSVSENARYPAGPLLFERLRHKAHIFLDDFVREGEQKAVQMWLRDSPDMTLFRHPFMKGCAELVKG